MRCLDLVDILGADYSKEWTFADAHTLQIRITKPWFAMWGPGGIAEQLNVLGLVGTNRQAFPVLNGAAYARQIAETTCSLS